MTKLTRNGEVIFAVAAVLLGIAVLLGTSAIKVPVASGVLGPRSFPYLVGSLLTVAALAALIGTLRGNRATPEDSELTDSSQPTNLRCVGAVIAAVVFFIFTVDFLGWIITCTATYFGIAVALGARRYTRLAIGSLLLAVIVDIGFTRGLGIPLPSGLLMSLARGMGPPDCQGDGTTVARY